MPNLVDPPPTIPWTRHEVATDDGVTLSAQSAGEGPPVLLGNGIGVTAPGLDYLAFHLLARHRVIAWDYRGIGRSRLNGRRVDVRVRRHAQDALQVLEALDAPRAAVLGWSMGVPVGLEMLRAAPGRVAAFGALFGAPGQPFRAAFPRPFSDVVHGVIRLSTGAPLPAQALLRLGATVPPIAWAICSTLGFVGRDARPEIFHADVRSTTEAQKRHYFRTMWDLVRHDARDVLPTIRCPVLVVCGGKDWVTPPEAAREMALMTPGARLVELPEASHFGVIEYGPELWDPVDDLLGAAFN